MARSRWARVVRGSFVALFAVFVATFSHVAAGGPAPGGVGTALALTFATLGCIAIAGRAMTLPRLTASVTASQLVFHVLFSVGSASSMQMHQASHHEPVTYTSTAASDIVQMHHSDGWMMLSHALAAVVTIVCLWRGERAAWMLLATATERLVAVLIGTFVLLPIRGSGVALTVARSSLHTLRDDLGVVLSILRHRGPPTRVLSL